MVSANTPEMLEQGVTITPMGIGVLPPSVIKSRTEVLIDLEKKGLEQEPSTWEGYVLL